MQIATLYEKCQNTEFSLVRIFTYSHRILENTDQKNYAFGCFSRSVNNTASLTFHSDGIRYLRRFGLNPVVSSSLNAEVMWLCGICFIHISPIQPPCKLMSAVVQIMLVMIALQLMGILWNPLKSRPSVNDNGDSMEPSAK